MPTSGFARQYGSVLGGLHRLLDIGLIFLALDLAAQFHDVGWSYRYTLAATWAAVLFLIGAEARQLYSSFRTVGLRYELRIVIWVWIGVFLGLIAIAFVTKTTGDFSRLAIAAWLLLAPLFLFVERMIFRSVIWYLRGRGINSRTAAIVGATPLGLHLKEGIESAPWTGLKTMGFYDERAPSRLPPNAREAGILGNVRDLLRDVYARKVDFVYVALPLTAKKRIVELVNALADTTASVYVVPDLFMTDLAQARWSSLGQIPVVSVFESPFLGVNGWLKRLEDIVLGTFIMAASAVPMMAIAMGVKLTSPGPVFFKQRRYGLNGRVVEVWKFRTMTVREDGETVAQARKHDPRVTHFGAFLRRTSLDELPQFFNVLAGDMSIVGPRPHAVAHNEQYRRLIHGYMLRHKVKPGITGWAQINGWRGETDTVEKMRRRVEYDLAYVRNWSLWLDIKIIWLTILKGFTGKNVY